MANPVVGQSESGDAVFGASEAGRGVVGVAKGGAGVEGNSASGAGVFGLSETGRGVVGVAKFAAGVEGNSASADGVFGTSESGRGVVGVAQVGAGVEGNSTSGIGIIGSSQTGIGVHARGGRLAGLFEGDVEVTGDIRFTNADCAEDFDIACVETAVPGTVMVIDEAGRLQESRQAYDKKVAGVISGAGNYKPGLILDKQESSDRRVPIALIGKVYCQVDASYGAIEVGDLLTTSPTSGHAMKAGDPFKAFGAVIGKALQSIENGAGLIPILVSLQ